MVSALYADRKGAVIGKDGRKRQTFVVVLTEVANNLIVDIVVGHTLGKEEIDCKGWGT